MLGILAKKLFGTKNERELRRLRLVVDQINQEEEGVRKLSDQMMRERMSQLREEALAGESLDNLLVEVFALVREAARRTLGERPFDVQVMGGIVLHQGKIAEMKTGEGKTLAATMPVCLNALTGRGVHIVTVNDYLAKRDANWMGEIYRHLGFTVGFIQHDMDFEERKKAYQADITYGTNNEFGFDYLRDNMVVADEMRVQRELHYAIVDEVDSILIDEARTPLIISGPAEESTELYYQIDRIIPHLKKGIDYEVDEKHRTAVLLEEGIAKAERLLKIGNLYEPANMEIVHHINQALRAHTLFKKDVDYIVKDGEVIIVDEFTGRLMPGRRYSDGLHQALEAKERVQIERENQTLATITLQNYFRLYKKLAGMTGTAATEETEFVKIYNLEVVVIPTHRPMIRKDYSDVIYRTEREKFQAVIEEIKELYRKGQPVLVGTISIEKSETLSRLLKKERIPHTVLNAKYHEQEAEIIKRAGEKYAVTIATNMAGRGVDIKLGEGVVELGGLHIIGTERHESRRIDNQLRGRSGRQGDPGSSRFYLSLEDDLMRIFGGEKIKNWMEKFGMTEGEVIEHPWITKSIETAQKRVEEQNFETRKHVLKYDDVMNHQRSVIYEQRQRVLKGENLKELILEMMRDVIEENVSFYCPDKGGEKWDLAGLLSGLEKIFPLKLSPEEEKLKGLKREEVEDFIFEKASRAYQKKEDLVGKENMRELEKALLLQTIDSKWKEHLHNMDSLRDSIHLRGYGQRDPLLEYKKESFDMFMEMVGRIKEDVLRYLFLVQFEFTSEEKRKVGAREAFLPRRRPPSPQPTSPPVKRRVKAPKIGRNEPCPCGSGKKYKRCCGR